MSTFTTPAPYAVSSRDGERARVSEIGRHRLLMGIERWLPARSAERVLTCHSEAGRALRDDTGRPDATVDEDPGPDHRATRGSREPRIARIVRCELRVEVRRERWPR